MRSLLNSMDNVDKLTEDLANLTDDTERMDTTQRQLLAQLDPTIATMQTVKDLAQTLTSAFSGLVTQMEDMTRNATVMVEHSTPPTTTTRSTFHRRPSKTPTSSGV